VRPTVVTSRIVAIAISIAGCSSDGTPPRADSNLGPREGGASCTLDQLGSGANCSAQWTCPGNGALLVTCGMPADAGVLCACVVGEDVVQTVSASPTNCGDAPTMTAFAKQYCGWTFL